jgi:hypothetical protein
VPAGGGSGTKPNLAALPVGANISFNVNAFPGKSWAVNTPFTDVTGAVMRRLTNRVFPVANGGPNMDYASGGPRISQAWGTNLDTYWIAFTINSNITVYKYQRGVGLDSTSGRAIPSGTANNGSLQYLFSTAPGETDIMYLCVNFGGEIRRWNCNTQSYAPNSLFTGANAAYSFSTLTGSNPGWIQQTWDGTRLCWLTPYVSATSCHYLFISAHGGKAAGTHVVYSGPQISNINDPRIAHGDSHIVYFADNAITGTTNPIAVWFVDQNVATAPQPNTRGGHCDAGETNLHSWDPDSGAFPLANQTPGTAPVSDGGAWNGTRTNLYSSGGLNVVLTADDHGSGTWNQTGAGNNEYYCFDANDATGYSAVGTWALTSGSIYQSTISLGAYGSAVRGVVGVITTNGISGSGMQFTGSLTAVGSQGAVTAGTYYWNNATSTLYVQMPDSSNPTGKIAINSGSLLNGSLGYARQDGGDTRRLCFTYHLFQDSVANYYHFPFANWSPDGKLVIFASDLLYWDGSVDIIAVDVPVS